MPSILRYFPIKPTLNSGKMVENDYFWKKNERNDSSTYVPAFAPLCPRKSKEIACSPIVNPY